MPNHKWTDDENNIIRRDYKHTRASRLELAHRLGVTDGAVAGFDHEAPPGLWYTSANQRTVQRRETRIAFYPDRWGSKKILPRWSSRIACGWEKLLSAEKSKDHQAFGLFESWRRRCRSAVTAGLYRLPSAVARISSKRASTFEGDYIAHGQTLLRELPIRKIASQGGAWVIKIQLTE